LGINYNYSLNFPFVQYEESKNNKIEALVSEALESIRGFSFFEKKTKTSNPLDLEVFDI
jgi:hypothetical protein